MSAAEKLLSTIIEPAVADILIRSRATLLQLLEKRGYDTTPYRNISPEQILTLAEGHPRALDIIVKKREDSDAPCDRAVVVHSLQMSLRLKLDGWIKELFARGADGSDQSRVKQTDDIIVILNEPYNEAFDKMSIQMWQRQKVRMIFLHIKQVVVNLMEHQLVPPHRKLTKDETKVELERLSVTEKSQLPLIKHHDIQARLLGLVPGDIVEVLRPSPTAGVMRVLRICAA